MGKESEDARKAALDKAMEAAKGKEVTLSEAEKAALREVGKTWGHS